MTDQTEDRPQIVSLPKAMTPRIEDLEKAVKRFCASGSRHDVNPEYIVYFCTMAGWQESLRQLVDDEGNGSAEALILSISNFVSAAMSMLPDEVYSEAMAYVMTAMIARDKQRAMKALAEFTYNADVPAGPMQ